MTRSQAQTAYNNAMSYFKELFHLGNIVGLLHWDQEVMMPKGSSSQRAGDTAALQTIIHQRTIAPKVEELLSELDAYKEELSLEESADLREAWKAYKQATLVPERLVSELAKLSVTATEKWFEARKEKQYSIFLPYLKETIELKREFADAIRGERSRYDALLDQYEPNETSAQLTEIFSSLRLQLVELLGKIKDAPNPTDPSNIQGAFAIEEQKAFCTNVIQQMGFSFEHGRLDRSSHPFCSGSGIDVRLTTRYAEENIEEGLFGAMHEAGHGLYEQGMAGKRLGRPAGVYASLGLHESQSRFWENMIGRSELFWEGQYPKLQAQFPTPFASLPLQEFWRSINHVEPSFIRTEADEVTYSLHIILRFEIELELVEGTLSPADIPEAWNTRFQESFGILPPDDALGCLQDIHWATGGVGYFPTYSLGNLYAAQFYAQMEQELDLPKLMQAGELLPIRDWLKQNVHQAGRTRYARELVQHVTGQPLSAKPFMEYLNTKYSKVYGF